MCCVCVTVCVCVCVCVRACATLLRVRGTHRIAESKKDPLIMWPNELAGLSSSDLNLGMLSLLFDCNSCVESGGSGVGSDTSLWFGEDLYAVY